jgi:thiol-disulfide isomerase/thioredoxin
MLCPASCWTLHDRCRNAAPNLENPMRMTSRLAHMVFLLCLSASIGAQTSDLVTAVRAATGAKDWLRAERLVHEHRAAQGTTSESILAVSWLARGAAVERRWEAAGAFATQTRREATTFLRGRGVDVDPFIPNAVGNALDVLAQVDVEAGNRSQAVAFIQQQLRTYRGTSIEKRLQKTLNTYTLVGSTAPALDLSEFIGAKPPALTSLRGQPVLLFFWAHWCADCKAQAPIITRLYEKHRAQGLRLVAPTQRFGYVAGGAPASAGDEKTYIEQVRAEYYPVLAGLPIPLSAANHLRYGVSSTPTLALVDRQGVVRLYNPGRMTEDALDAEIQKVVGTAR